MKWSELFGNLLGDKDVDITPATTTTNQMQSTQGEGQSHTDANILTTANSLPDSTQQTTSTTTPSNDQNHTQQEFDMLNARIKELEKANLQLIMQGSLKDTEPEKTDEEIIMDLCVGRRRNGAKINNSNSSTAEL